ncbi:MAG: copper chaperone PCu(A)C [Paracoccus sp. (in: a-proteobacteria)]|nr:copper chaperone PCu(A)C [Paracoccus sp. (in: a-proteobacteria)]
MKPTILSALCALAFALPAAATLAAPVQISDAYARSSNPKSGAAFMIIANEGADDCTLIGGFSPRAGRVELHTSRENDAGLMEMVALDDGITIPAHGTHHLARGGDHLMLMELPEPLAQGDEVPVTLDFGSCGTVELLLPLDNDRRAEHGAGDHSAH